MTARVMDRLTVAAPTPRITVVQALPKSDRSELAIELATEAGADAFVAWQASRCVARWDGQARVDKGLRRWRAVARSAARQSRRAYIPTSAGWCRRRSCVERIRDIDIDAGAGAARIRERSRSLTCRVAEADSLMLVIGPEGGIADDEIAALSGGGCHGGATRAHGVAHLDGRGRRAGRPRRAHEIGGAGPGPSNAPAADIQP